ncbi:hypothetical protein [Henriciella aquimarina]|uniref:hypothetical protein n=1 Tax=Henriciella aquimarina TaxID=545261 RepID=UPI000A017A3C|nr:hypothetical protein [Henriciella aquimarina]
MTKYKLVVLMDVPEDLYGEWADWNRDHARDMVNAGFISGQTFKVRPDYEGNHPEALPFVPPYSMVNIYEVDEPMLETMLLTKTPEMGQGPAGGSRPFPSPLGKHMGDGYLLEPDSEAFHSKAVEEDLTRYRLVLMMDVPVDLLDEWKTWNRDHARDLAQVPGFISAQSYTVRDDYAHIHPESLPDRPPYKVAVIFEVNEHALESMLRKRPAVGQEPEAGTRTFPSPLGKHLGDGFLLEPIGEEYRKP